MKCPSHDRTDRSDPQPDGDAEFFVPDQKPALALGAYEKFITNSSAPWKPLYSNPDLLSKCIGIDAP